MPLVAWTRDVRGKPHPLEHSNLIVGDVQLPPLVLVGGACRIVMVVVVPPLAEGQQRQQHVVLARVGGVELPGAPHVVDRVDGEGDVPVGHRAPAEGHREPLDPPQVDFCIVGSPFDIS